jgi:hypothetical protein
MQTLPPTHTTLQIVTVGVEYVAPARMPRELRMAGFRIAMLAPAEAWCTRSRFIELLGHLPVSATLGQCGIALEAMLEKVQPAAILPGDDALLMAMMQIVLTASAKPDGTPLSALPALLRHSLGNPDHYAASVDKARLVNLARAAGIAVPAGEAVDSIDDALKVSRSLGYPVIVRPTVGTSSRGVAICRDEREVREAFLALPARPPARWPQPIARTLVQKFLEGVRYNRASVAWRGREIAGYTRTALERWPDALGAGSVTRFVHAPAIAEASARLAEALDMSGFAGTQFIEDPATGKPCLIEINRRMVPATHAGKYAGVDLAEAFAAALRGQRWSGPVDTLPDRQVDMVLFPQEWKRDNASHHLESLPVDAPWDDPRVFAAMLGARG